MILKILLFQLSKKEFLRAEFRGCFFIWSKIQNDRLQRKYSQDTELQVRLLCSMALKTTNIVIKAFYELIESEYYIQNEELLSPIIMYFENM